MIIKLLIIGTMTSIAGTCLFASTLAALSLFNNIILAFLMSFVLYIFYGIGAFCLGNILSKGLDKL